MPPPNFIDLDLANSISMNRTSLLILGSTALFVGAACLGDDLQNRQLLETLPRDRRESLAENLAEFDRLSSTEQAAIRRLDETIATTEPTDQARYRSLLHHYHLWFQGLTVEQRDQLLATTDLDERFALARKFRMIEKAGPKRDGPRVARIRTGEFGLLGPYEAAYLLKVWKALAPEKQVELGKQPFVKIRDELKNQASSLKMSFDRDRFPGDQDKTYAAKLESEAEFKLIEPILRKLEQAPRKAEATKKAANVLKKGEHPFAELLYFEDNRPRLVDQGRLERFASSSPDWFRAVTDSLSADDARDYYLLLYRLLYPSPAEMPEPVKPSKVGPETAIKKAPRPKADPGAAF